MNWQWLNPLILAGVLATYMGFYFNPIPYLQFPFDSTLEFLKYASVFPSFFIRWILGNSQMMIRGDTISKGMEKKECL